MRKELLLSTAVLCTAVLLASVGMASAQTAPGAQPSQHQQTGQSPGGQGSQNQGLQNQGLQNQGSQNQGKQNQTQGQQFHRDQTTGQGQGGQAKEPTQQNQRQSGERPSAAPGKSMQSGTSERNQTTGQSNKERSQTTGQAQQPPTQAQPSQRSEPSQAQQNQAQPNQQVQQSQASGTVTLTAEQRTRVQQTILASRDVPRVNNVNFAIAVGTVVPTSLRIVEVPATLIEIHPEWRGHMYFVLRDEIIIVDHGHRIVAIVPTGSSAQLGAGERDSMAMGSGTMSVEEIRQVQIMLNQKGFNVGGPDGVFGARTRQALIAFQRQQGFQASGQLDSRTMSALGVSSTQQQGVRGQPSTVGSQPSSTNQPAKPSAASPSTASPSTAAPSTAGQGSSTPQNSPTTGSGAGQSSTSGAGAHPQTPNAGTSAPSTSSPSTSSPSTNMPSR